MAPMVIGTVLELVGLVLAGVGLSTTWGEAGGWTYRQVPPPRTDSEWVGGTVTVGQPSPDQTLEDRVAVLQGDLNQLRTELGVEASKLSAAAEALRQEINRTLEEGNVRIRRDVRIAATGLGLTAAGVLLQLGAVLVGG